MPLALATLVLAVAVSLLRGGRLGRLAAAQLRWNWLLFAGVGIQVVVDVAAGRGIVSGAVTYVGIALSQAAVLAWVLANRRRPGVALIGLGLLLNVVVIGANGAMPVDPGVAPEGAALDVAPGKHEFLTEDTRLPWLADVIPVAPIRTIVSVGDIVLALGVAVLVHHLMTRTVNREGDRSAREGRGSS